MDSGLSPDNAIRPRFNKLGTTETKKKTTSYEKKINMKNL